MSPLGLVHLSISGLSGLFQKVVLLKQNCAQINLKRDLKDFKEHSRLFVPRLEVCVCTL